MDSHFLAELARLVGDDALLRDPADLLTYESDALAHLRATPGVVVLPATPSEVQAVVRLCHREGVPFVARGHGTGLSGGALPSPDGVLIVPVPSQPRARHRHSESARYGRAWRHQSGDHAARGAVRLLLRARPVQSDRVLDWRQHRRELGRCALPEVRLHRSSCARRRKPCCPTATSCSSVAPCWTRRDSICSASSSAPRARSRLSPRRRSASCGGPKPCRRCWPVSHRSTQRAKRSRPSSSSASFPRRSK